MDVGWNCFLLHYIFSKYAKSFTGLSAASGNWGLNYLSNINLQDYSPCKIDQTNNLDQTLKLCANFRISSEKRSDMVLSQNSKVEIYFELSIKETYLFFKKEKETSNLFKRQRHLHISYTKEIACTNLIIREYLKTLNMWRHMSNQT